MPDSLVANSEAVHILTAEFLTPAQVAALLKTSRKELADMRVKRAGPPFELKARGVVVYPADGLRRYLRALPQSAGFGARSARRGNLN
ncbi:MAG: hypothetical protein ABSF45_15975 [Terriglobia bacterium]